MTSSMCWSSISLMSCFVDALSWAWNDVVHPSAVSTLRLMVPALVVLSMTSLLSKRVERELLRWSSSLLPPSTAVCLGAFVEQCSHHICLSQSKISIELASACKISHSDVHASQSHCYLSMKRRWFAPQNLLGFAINCKVGSYKLCRVLCKANQCCVNCGIISWWSSYEKHVSHSDDCRWLICDECIERRPGWDMLFFPLDDPGQLP